MPLVVRPGRPKAASAPNERGFSAYLGGQGGFASGYWECDPGELKLTNYPVDEFCNLFEGEIEIIAAHGESITVRGGDAFVIPRGFSGIWKIKSRARKLFACAGGPQQVAAITGNSSD